MAAHRYWRVGIVGLTNVINGPISEVELRTSIGGADVTGSGAASVDSAGAGTAANVFDNNAGTTWSPQSASGASTWVSYDFGAGSPQDIAEVVITSTATYPAHTAQHCAVLSYSDDGVVWVALGPPFGASALVGGGTLTMSGFVASTARVTGPPIIRYGNGWPTGQIVYRMSSRVFRHDAVDGGVLSLDGTCEVDSTPTDIPVRRQVRLLERSTARLVRETWSDPATGAWVFPSLKDNLFTVIGHDYTLVNLAVIFDNVRPT
jgi:hypothetical protein